MQIEVSLPKLQLFLAGYLSARAAVPYSPVHFQLVSFSFFYSCPLFFFCCGAFALVGIEYLILFMPRNTE